MDEANRLKIAGKEVSALAYLFAERYDDLYEKCKWGYVRTSDRLYAAILQEIWNKFGGHLRKITWGVIRDMHASENLALATAIKEEMITRRLMLEVFVHAIHFPSKWVAEADVLIPISQVTAVSGGEEMRVFLRHLQILLKFPPTMKIYEGGIRVSVYPKGPNGDDFPKLIPLPPEQKTNGHGQEGFVTFKEYLQGKYSPIR